MAVGRLLFVAVLTLASSPRADGQATPATPTAEIATLFQNYDSAYNAKDLTRLGSFYHQDVTVFEGGSVDRGWVAYRDHHLGKELRSFQDLKWSHSNLQVQALNSTSAYVTANYSLSYVGEGIPVVSRGLATHVLTKDDGKWRIRHTHTSSRR